jgi:hypothetical protein
MEKVIDELVVRTCGDGKMVITAREMSPSRRAISEALDRAQRVLKCKDRPLFWAAVIPAKPLDKIIEDFVCLRFHKNPRDTLNTCAWETASVKPVPGGTMGYREDQNKTPLEMTYIGFDGLVFIAKCLGVGDNKKWIAYREINELVKQTLYTAGPFYGQVRLSDSSQVNVCVGIENALACKLCCVEYVEAGPCPDARTGPYPDEKFHFECESEYKNNHLDHADITGKLDKKLKWDFGQE